MTPDGVDQAPQVATEQVESAEAVRIRLFGRDYTVKGHGNRKYVEKLTEFINEKAGEIQRRARVVSTLDLVILTLLNVTDELFQCRKSQDMNVTGPEE